jgi:hypothetical protein
MRVAALYSKNCDSKQSFVSDFVADERGPILYVYPKNMEGQRLTLPNAYGVTYEDIDKRDTWLHINALIGDSTILIMENPSRYPKATTPKSRTLRRLSMQVKTKAIVDIVPFTEDIQYLYTPLSFLDRSILGYAHYYAFRENYQEMDDSGVIRSAHDYDVLADKMKSVCRIDYDGFLLRSRTVVDCPVTAGEFAQYATRKDELFSVEKSPQRIVTRLADTAHAFQSRTTRLLEVLAECHGQTLVLCNLASYAKRAQSAAKAANFRNVVATSYQVAMREDVAGFDNVVYLESPIVNSYYLLDVEAALPSHCNVYHFRGDAKVDQYLYGEIDRELRQIHGLTKELYCVARL